MADDSSSMGFFLTPVAFIGIIIFSAWFQYEILNLSIGYIVFDTILFIGFMIAFAGNDGQ